MSDRFKFRVWNPDGKYYDDDPQYNVCVQIDPISGLVLAPFHNNIIEMCTGVKDKNGNLIYEGDLIKSPNNSYALVVYYDITGLWRCKENRPNGTWELPLYDLVRNYGVEIIGNVHTGENK